MTAGRPSQAPAALEGLGLCVRFGGIQALSDVTVRCAAGQVVAVIGPNGAGKSTLFNALCGLAPVSGGAVRVAGRALGEGRRPAKAIAAAALAVGLAIAILCCNADSLWRRAVVEPYRAQVLAERHGEPRPSATWLGALVEAVGDEPWIRAERDGYLVCQGPARVASAASWQQARNLRDARARARAPHTRGAWLRFVATLVVAGVAAGAWLTRLAARAARGPRALACAGVARTFQNIRLFDALTARDNVRVVCERRHSGARAGSRADALLARLRLSSRADVPAGQLSYGERRRLEIARALALEPKVLLLDEPAAGLHAAETAELLALVRALRREGLAVLLIEHDMALVMDVSDQVLVLDHGAAIAMGTPAAIRRDPAVIAAYLGEHPEAAALRAARGDEPCSA